MSKKLLLPEQAKDWLARRYDNQHRSWLGGNGEWPLCVPLGSLTERDVTDDIYGVRAWVDSWTQWQGPGDVCWDERKWARLGAQRLPVSLNLQSAREVASCVGQVKSWSRAFSRYAEVSRRWPQLGDQPGVARHFDVLANYSEPDFERLTSALAWFLANPASGVYVRQVPIAGLDTKWLEKRTGLIVDLLALLRGSNDGTTFFEACGLRRPAHRIRMRFLCPELRSAVGGLGDIEAPMNELAALAVRPCAVLIVENLETGIALPDIPGAVAFMKLGNAVGNLAALPWLQGLPAVYWGDIDTHGLAILDRARKAIPDIQSVLMNEETLLAHRSLWGNEPAQHPESELPSLTLDERAVFAGLKSNRWGTKVRLEQERIPWAAALQAIRRALPAH